MPDQFDKVKAVGIAALFTIAIAAVAAGLQFTSTVDWSGFGIFGPAVALAIGTGGSWLLAFLKKEFRGYGTKRAPQLTKED